MSTSIPEVRTGQGSTKLSRSEFEVRYRAQYWDPAFDAAKAEVERLTSIAWDADNDSRENSHTRKAGPEFADPQQEPSPEWLVTRAAIDDAQSRFEDRCGNSRTQAEIGRCKRRFRAQKAGSSLSILTVKAPENAGQ